MQKFSNPEIKYPETCSKKLKVPNSSASVGRAPN